MRLLAFANLAWSAFLASTLVLYYLPNLTNRLSTDTMNITMKLTSLVLRVLWQHKQMNIEQGSSVRILHGSLAI
jgi:hypothetical protein